MRELHFDEFADCVGETYELISGDRRLPLTLEAAQPLPRSLRESGSFRLAFRGPYEPILPQAIYRLERNGEGYDIFIVPIARDPAGTQYEAIFN
ncbi:MAG TPA: hypothetical protein VEA61_01680 [Allosphingosinicella sp.]|nr:hypothetical protein [Allosphingosinicella sp.]